MLTSTKPPKCKWCKSRTDKLGKNLHDDCVAPWLEDFYKKQSAKQRKEQAAKAKVERASDKKRKEAAMRLPDLKELVQREFNKWVRTRDKDQPCISCGKQPGEMTFQGGRDAGHYRSIGSAAHLRYREDNVHAQCVHCNKYGAGKAVDYRIGLVKRIGLERVEALEVDNAIHKFTREELIAIKHTYRAKRRALEQEKEANELCD